MNRWTDRQTDGQAKEDVCNCIFCIHSIATNYDTENALLASRVFAISIPVESSCSRKGRKRNHFGKQKKAEAA